ncbi:MAG TPA: hypothetical protein VN303_12615, partial [Pseudomonas sp.]|nr:hypothetical protein [Pseudomonas sp.]
DSFVSTKAAHSTAAFTSVKPILKIFSFLLNRLRYPHETSMPVTGGELYRLKTPCQQLTPEYLAGLAMKQDPSSA